MRLSHLLLLVFCIGCTSETPIAKNTEPVSVVKNEVVEQYRKIMPKAGFDQTLANSKIYAEIVFGYCFERVRGKPLQSHTINPDNWEVLGNAEVTRNLKLFNPKISPDNFTILDVADNNKTCWTQHDTIAAALSLQSILEPLELVSADLSPLASKDGKGFAQRTYLYNPDADEKPVEIYIYSTFSPQQERILTIVKTATLSPKEE